MKDANIKVAQDLQKTPVPRESERVKERLRILLEEEKEYMGQGGSAKTSAPTSTSKNLNRKFSHS